MHLTIELPNRSETLASNRERWAEVLADRELAVHGYRVETNAFGQVIMTPPAGGPHSSRQSQIAYWLQNRRGGRGLVECPISTSDGVRAADVGWYSVERYAHVRGQLAFELAPEICVEVESPRNTELELRIKRQLYFDAGAQECWQCDLEGRMSYYLSTDPETKRNQSTLCPDFPNTIED
ncbi:Uma2 family endonuclease [Novipirellula artificiosorum]|uniref:Putative restriction endonuclease domain-containing protein n=1 Tax=Novipirellula artificiosorum TaxID=2528016 RepID=A0A5C6DF53_9BACT|nr:Uma2 family endonuclease [Novipirellula artificiosorum]TWU33756.1 hypothetical protein Poly41_47530 [Novipirellula artificiosorum]